MPNNTTNYDVSGQDFHLVYNSITATLAITITIANLVVISIFCCNTKIQRKTANLLLCDQSLVDLINGAVVGGITVFGSSAPEKIKASIYQLSIGLSLHTVVLISVERYIFILKPFYHRTKITVKKVIVAIVISWCCSLVWIPCRLAHYESGENVNWDSYVWFIVVSDVFIFLIITGVGILHLLAFRAVKACIKQNYERGIFHKNKQSVHEKEKLHCRLQEMRVSKIFIAMFLAFIFTYAPVFVTGILFISGGFKYIDENDMMYFSLDLLFYLATSLFNPIVTLALKEDFRKAICKVLYSMHTNETFKVDTETDSYPLSPRDIRNPTVEKLNNPRPSSECSGTSMAQLGAT